MRILKLFFPSKIPVVFISAVLIAAVSFADTGQQNMDVETSYSQVAVFDDPQDSLNVDSLEFEGLKRRLQNGMEQIRYKSPDALSGLIVALEVLGLNFFVWSWDYYILDKNYAHTGPKYWKRNLREGWEWDHNHWAINFFGHPYQGSMYYMTAREGGYGFYRSLAFAMLGSLTWEMFAETEYPAPNDFVTTSIAGSLYGEVLFRLSRLAFGSNENAKWYRHAASFGLAPAGYVQRMAFGERERRLSAATLNMALLIGGGSRFGSDYHFGSTDVEKFDEEWRDYHGDIAFHLEYGKPNRKVHDPLDYFTINALYEQGLKGNLLEMDVTGKLVNGTIHGQGHWFDFAMYMDYGTFYGDFATVGTVSLGGGLDVAVHFSPSRSFRITNIIYWIMLGTADMGYDELIKEVYPDYSSEMDNYQYNTGVKYTLYLELMLRKRFTISNRSVLDILHTIPGSLPHYGAQGWDVILLNYTTMDYKIRDWFSIGSQLRSYFKFAAYSTEMFEPMSRRIFSYTTYAKFMF